MQCQKVLGATKQRRQKVSCRDVKKKRASFLDEYMEAKRRRGKRQKGRNKTIGNRKSQGGEVEK